MKLGFGKLKPETIVIRLFIVAVLLIIFPRILVYIFPALIQSFPIVSYINIFGGIILTTILIWLLCEALYLILKASQSIIDKNSNQE